MERYIYIAGASSRAQTTREYFEFLYPGLKVSAYLVSPEMPDCNSIINGIDVLPIADNQKLNTAWDVFIATRGVNHSKIKSELLRIGFRHIIPVTPELDTKLRNLYVNAIFEKENRKFEKINTINQAEIPFSHTSETEKSIKNKLSEVNTKQSGLKQSNEDSFSKKGLSSNDDNAACIYVVSTAGEHALKETYHLLSEERIIQAGASLTSERIPGAYATDDIGENISKRNRQFCELTALYWIWKHAHQNYIGIVHYRRHFLLPNDWLTRMKTFHIDVLLPVPLYVAPTLEGNYLMRHDPRPWKIMQKNLKLTHPEDFDPIMHYCRTTGLYSPCNMFIMRRDILKDYCEWLFPVLLETADQVGQLNDSYQNRYPGFLSERLLTAYFAEREDKIKIVYADKNFLK